MATVIQWTFHIFCKDTEAGMFPYSASRYNGRNAIWEGRGLCFRIDTTRNIIQRAEDVNIYDS